MKNLIVAALALLIITTVGSYFFLQSKVKIKVGPAARVQKQEVATSSPQRAQVATTSNSLEYIHYRSDALGFETDYPSTWTVATSTDDSSQVLTFQSPAVEGKAKGSGILTFKLRHNANQKKLTIVDWYKEETKKIKDTASSSVTESTMGHETALVKEQVLGDTKQFTVLVRTNESDVLSAQFVEDKTYVTDYARILSRVAFIYTRIGIVAFDGTNGSSTWPRRWRLFVPETEVGTSSLQLVSRLVDSQPLTAISKFPDFDEDIVLKVLADAKDIQPEPGMPINIEFLLNDTLKVNATGPRNYAYSEILGGFSRYAYTPSDGKGSSVTPFVSSFPIHVLGNKIVKASYETSSGFQAGKCVLASIVTTDGVKNYTYTIALEKKDN